MSRKQSACIPDMPRVAVMIRNNLQGDERFRSLKNGGIRVLVVISYVVYTPVTNKAFRALRPCDTFDTGEAFLHEDYRVECSTEEYEHIRGVAIFAVVVYTSLTPIWYGCLLRSGSGAIRREFEEWQTPEHQEFQDEDERRLRNLKVLYKSYTPERWWWEIYETIRKFVLTGVIALIAPGSLEQSVFLIIFAGVASLIYQEFRPFKETSDHILGLVSTYCIFLIAFIALLLTFSRELDILDPTLVNLISLFAVLAPGVLALTFVLVQCIQGVNEYTIPGNAGQAAEVNEEAMTLNAMPQKVAGNDI